jgi:hypothetical protein
VVHSLKGSLVAEIVVGGQWVTGIRRHTVDWRRVAGWALCAGLSGGKGVRTDWAKCADSVLRGRAGVTCGGHFEGAQRVASILGDTVNRGPEAGRAVGARLVTGQSVSSDRAECALSILRSGTGIAVLSQTVSSNWVTSVLGDTVNRSGLSGRTVRARLGTGQSVCADRAESALTALRSGTGIAHLGDVVSAQWVTRISRDAVNGSPETRRARCA